MQAAFAKEQTAFRFEKELISRMKKAAKRQKKSLNQYVTDLIVRDLEQQEIMPTAVLSDGAADMVALYAGKMTIPSEVELRSDERLEKIWER